MKPFFLRLSERNFFYVTLLFCSFLCMTNALAEKGAEVVVESADDYGSLREGWRKLSKEERDELRQQMRAAWQNISPEDKERFHERCREENKPGGWGGRWKDDKPGKGKGWGSKRCSPNGYRAHWHDLSPEDQEALRNKLREVLRQKESAQEQEMPAESILPNQQSEALAQ